MRSTRYGEARRRWRAAVLGALLAALTLLGGTPALADTFSSPSTGTHAVTGAILDRYRALGAQNGVLGYSTTEPVGTPRAAGAYQLFQRGSIYWSAGTGAHALGGAIRDRWGALGWENGVLGFPITDEVGTPNGRGRYNVFQGGSVYWSAATGAHALGGAIRATWGALGWENSFLGFPTTDELVTPNGQGRFNVFQGGSVYWSPATGARSIGGAIRDLWGRTGFENSPLGFPTTNEFPVPGGRAQDFQYGSIRWTPATGAVVVGAQRAGGGLLPLGVSPPGTQLVTVVASRPGATVATLVAWEKRAAGWTPVLGPLTAQIGSLGIGIASESTARTPAGTFPLTEAFGRQANPGTALPYRVIDGDDWWVSDVRSARYNQHYRCAPGTCPFDEAAGERLAAAGAVYDHAVVIDYNRAGVRGAGSAFFLHISNNSPTAGCVAIGAGSLQQLMRWLSPAARPVIAIGIG